MAKRYLNLFHVTLRLHEKLGSLSQNLDCSPHLSLPTSLRTTKSLQMRVFVMYKFAVLVCFG